MTNTEFPEFLGPPSQQKIKVRGLKRSGFIYNLSNVIFSIKLIKNG